MSSHYLQLHLKSLHILLAGLLLYKCSFFLHIYNNMVDIILLECLICNIKQNLME